MDSRCICELDTASPSQSHFSLENYKDQTLLSSGLIETASNSMIRSRVGYIRGPKRNRTCTTLNPNPAANSPVITAPSDDWIRAAHSFVSTVSSDSLIRPITSRDARSERVRKENPLPTAENPLRLLPSTSCSTRNIIMSAFISAFEVPSDRGSRTSIWSAAFGGGQVAVITNTPATLMSRVTPSPWYCPSSGPLQRNITDALIR